MWAQLSRKSDDFGVCRVLYIVITMGIASPPVFRGIPFRGEQMQSQWSPKWVPARLKVWFWSWKKTYKMLNFTDIHTK